MRVRKDDKYNSILQAAREEFVKKGFKDASMRAIAKNAGVGLSNIYNYFENKDDIFLAVVKPAKDDLYNFIYKQHTEESIDYNRISSFGHQEDAVEYYIDLICRYKEELKLLLYSSQGSSQENFRETFTDYLTQISYNYMEMERKHYPEANKVSHFFIRVISSWMVSTLGQIVSHDLTRPKIREFFREFFRFEFAGWREITGT